MEIERLVARSLRGAVDLEALGPVALTVDCDILNADGGTRCASITAACMGLRLAVRRLIESGECLPKELRPSREDISNGWTAPKLTDEEKRHPFWTTGLGAEAVRRVQDPASDGGSESGAEPTSVSEMVARLFWRQPKEPSAADLAAAALPPPPSPPPPPPRGLFIHGGVGAGKTLLMDLFAQQQIRAQPAQGVSGASGALPPPPPPAPPPLGCEGVDLPPRTHCSWSLPPYLLKAGKYRCG